MFLYFILFFFFFILTWSPTLSLRSLFSMSRPIYVLDLTSTGFIFSVLWYVLLYINYVVQFINKHIFWYCSHIFVDVILQGSSKFFTHNGFSFILYHCLLTIIYCKSLVYCASRYMCLLIFCLVYKQTHLKFFETHY